MKKVITSILFIVLFLIFPKEVFATGGVSVSQNSLSMEVGESKTFNIIADNVIGDGNVYSNNSSVATVDVSSWETGAIGEGQEISRTVTVTGVAAGTTTIIVTVDAATFDSEPIPITSSKTIQVTVKKKQGPLPSQVVKPNQSQNQTQNQTQTNTKDDKKEEEVKKSNNNKIKELAVVGYDLIKTDDNNYRLSVGYDVDVIVVKAVAEDKKAAITGNGEHTLHVGKNDIELVVTAEDGTQNKVNIVVNRKEEVIEEPTEPVKTIGDDNESKEKPLNIIAIAMIGLNVVLAISVVALLIKNNKLKKMNN